MKGTPTKRLTDPSAIGAATIKIESNAPDPVYEDKDFTIAESVTADTAAIEYTKDDVKYEYTNTAIYKAAFNLETLTAEAAKAFGFKIGETKIDVKADITGEGTVDCILAVFGITADKATTASTYYTKSVQTN